MGIFNTLFGLPEMEERAMSIESPNSSFMHIVNMNSSATLPTVTIDNALTVPAVWAAVTFLSRTLAALPLHSYRNTKTGPEKISGGLQTLVHDAPNAEWPSFKLRQYFWQQVFTGGRGLIWIERSGTNIIGMWPIDPTKATIKRDDLGRTSYTIGSKTYPAADVIDVSFMLKADQLSHYGPITQGAKAIQLALAMNDYGSTFFAGGGVPPLVIEGPMPAGKDAMARALADINRSIKSAQDTGTQITAIPPGYRLTPIGVDPDKGQMTDGRRFQIEEIARVYNLPPVFLQDLTHGTFSNTEQQDLHLTKHLVAQWAEALEQEMNLKLFGQRNGGRYVEHNLDGLLRGDFASRMAGLAQGIQNAILTPNEGRALENRAAKDNGDDLLIQGATVPLGTQQVTPPADPQANSDGNGA